MKLIVVFLAVLVAFAHTALAKNKRQQESVAGQFDYYSLALSWSPTYCLDHESDEQQCGLGRRFAFVVHGLWPQYEKGYPNDCALSGQPDKTQVETMLDIMPSTRLVRHEWKKHGTCSGLTATDYFKLTRALFGAVRIPARYLSPTADVLVSPEQLVTDFVKTNKGLTSDMISVQCGGRRENKRLKELRICFDKSGAFRQCGSNEARQCKAENIIMPRVRN